MSLYLGFKVYNLVDSSFQSKGADYEKYAECIGRINYQRLDYSNGNNEKWNSGSTIKFHYDDDQIGIRDKKLDLNAIWKANTYYVQYNGNGNNGGRKDTYTHTYET